MRSRARSLLRFLCLATADSPPPCIEADIASRYCAISASMFFSFCLNSSESVRMLDFRTCIL